MPRIMRIAYCTNVRIPSERAHGHQIAQVCDALAALGHEVKVFHPYRKNAVKEDYWTYHGADKRVKLQTIGAYDFIGSPLPGVLKLWVMNWYLRRMLPQFLSETPFDLLYTRTPALLAPLLATGQKTILELHQLPRRSRAMFVAQCNNCLVVAALTSSMRDTLIEWGVHPEKVMIAGDAVDIARFASLPSQAAARIALGIRTPRPVVGYVGRLTTLGMEKGVAEVLAAVARTKGKPRPWFALIVGGPENDRRRYEQLARKYDLGADDVCFTGAVESDRVPVALAACDALAMPFPDLPHYRFAMSPLKMFEYMAACKPIVTSDLPTIRDVLSEDTAFFCPPGDAQCLAARLEEIADMPAEAAKRAHKALELVKAHHTWEERMKGILERLDF